MEDGRKKMEDGRWKMEDAIKSRVYAIAVISHGRSMFLKLKTLAINGFSIPHLPKKCYIKKVLMSSRSAILAYKS